MVFLKVSMSSEWRKNLQFYLVQFFGWSIRFLLFTLSLQNHNYFHVWSHQINFPYSLNFFSLFRFASISQIHTNITFAWQKNTQKFHVLIFLNKKFFGFFFFDFYVTASTWQISFQLRDNRPFVNWMVHLDDETSTEFTVFSFAVRMRRFVYPFPNFNVCLRLCLCACAMCAKQSTERHLVVIGLRVVRSIRTGARVSNKCKRANWWILTYFPAISSFYLRFYSF